MPSSVTMLKAQPMQVVLLLEQVILMQGSAAPQWRVSGETART